MCTICKECVATKVRSSQLENVHAVNVDTQQCQGMARRQYPLCMGLAWLWCHTHTVYVCMYHCPSVEIMQAIVCHYGTV